MRVIRLGLWICLAAIALPSHAQNAGTKSSSQLNKDDPKPFDSKTIDYAEEASRYFLRQSPR